MKIDIANQSTVLTDAAVEAALPAFKHYARLVANAWGLRTPTLEFLSNPSPTNWQIIILDDADQAGALGLHDFAVNGKPIAKVFAKTDLRYGASWTVTLTHELSEMQCDPFINTCVQTSNSRAYALEVGDPVEDDSFGFVYTDSNGYPVLLSDFVLPAWFQPGAKGPFDYKHHCTRPLQILYNGYAQYLDAGTWHQLNEMGQKVPMDKDDLRIRSRW